MRLFVGVPVPSLDLAGTGIVRTEAHLTLAFLGEVEAGREDELIRAIGVALEGATRFHVEFRGVGAFPTPTAPRVVWIGVTEGAEPMIALARQLHERLRDAGFPSDDRPPVPHVTLFRVRSPSSAARARQLLRDLGDRSFGESVVTTVTLWESELCPAGPIHTPRRSWALPGTTG